jgi:hypothetical protein
VSVDHGCFDILVTQQLLHGANIVAVFKQVGGKAVPKRMAATLLGDTSVQSKKE